MHGEQRGMEHVRREAEPCEAPGMGHAAGLEGGQLTGALRTEDSKGQGGPGEAGGGPDHGSGQALCPSP